VPASVTDRLIREAADARMTLSGYVRQILVTAPGRETQSRQG